MKIKRISLWHQPLTSHETYYMSDGKTCDTVDTVVVRLETDTGLSGWGEVCPIPHYLPAYAGGVAPALQEMAPILIGADPIGPEAVMQAMDIYLQGHVYAKSPVDMAIWDLTAQAAQMPLYRLLGGRRQKDMPVYHSITCIAPDDMARIARDTYAQGVRQFQVKLGADQDPSADIERLIKVREAVGDGPLVYGDWNCGSTQLDASRVGRAVQHLDIMLEQPCKTMAECSAVRDATSLPMKMDESAHDMASLLEAYQRGIMDAVALKISKFGGVSALRQARDLCLHLGAKMCIEDTWGSDITTAAIMHIGASTTPSAVMNVCDLSGYVGPRLDDKIPTRKNGRMTPPEGIGLGVSPDLDLLGQAHVVID